LALLAALTLVVGCGSGATSSSGSQSGNKVVTQTRTVSGYSALTFTGIGTLSIQQVGTEGLKVTAPESVLPMITSTVSGNDLTIGFTGDASSVHDAVTYVLGVKTLNTIQLSGPGTIRGGGLTPTDLKVTVAGSGSMALAGHSQTQTITVSNHGIFDGSSFASNAATVTVSDQGTATVNVVGTLDATASANGSIKYLGNPTVTKSVSGSGSVSP
jgi:hypothetical protein